MWIFKTVVHIKKEVKVLGVGCHVPHNQCLSQRLLLAGVMQYDFCHNKFVISQLKYFLVKSLSIELHLLF